MIYIKYVSLIGILCTSCYIGFFKAKKFEYRLDELIKFQSSLIMFKSKLKFTHEPIRNIFNDISILIYKDKENIFGNVAANKTDIYSSWIEGVINQNNFTKGDKEIIKTIGKLLGKTDLDGQVSEIDLGLELVEKQINEAEIERNKNVKLYKTMGIVCGIGICIILI